MAPSATDYLHGLRRLWWIPMAALLVGVGLGIMAAGTGPTVTTRGYAVFTFRADDAGQESAGTARGAEASVADSRLAAYLQIAGSSQRVAEFLGKNGFQQTSIQTLAPGLASGERIGISNEPVSQGVVELWMDNGDLNQAEATRIVEALTRTVADEVSALDAAQETPSLRTDVLVTEPQPKFVPASRFTQGAVRVLLLLVLGLGLVYLLVWRQGRIQCRRDIEERLGVRVLGDMNSRSADAAAIALALCKGRPGTTTALLVPAGRVRSDNASRVGELVAAAGLELGLEVHRSAVEPATLPGSVAPPASPAYPEGANHSRAAALVLVDACAVGLNRESLHAAVTVDIVALIAVYDATSYRELTEAGRTIAELTEAEVAVIGVHRGGVPTLGPLRGARHDSSTREATTPRGTTIR